MPICKPQALGWQTGPPRGMVLCNMAKLVRNKPGKKNQNGKRDNTMINLTQETQELCIFTKFDKFGPDLQNNQWPNTLKRQLEEPTSEDELPSIANKLIDINEETFHILVDGIEKINGHPFKSKTKRQQVRFSENHDFTEAETTNEIEKDSKIMEKRDKNLKETYHINFFDRPLNNQEPYEWQLESPEIIQQPPNEDEETK
ncbi:hypothetical protein O181_058360 [Austropuccinia psidii MF-1]|uniref:Uncharacterized protein n=1 Tax=Austropuccinia psidii MF-1 TaxID=1389203 RepID=A0A9Q3EGC7_9BASI|nr:hypothetical protein [Austropuccinia psidii MF-1]